jgi:hypothetical protein
VAQDPEELPSSAHPFLSNFSRGLWLRARCWSVPPTGGCLRRQSRPTIMTCYMRVCHDVQVDQLARRGAHSLGFNRRAACLNGIDVQYNSKKGCTPSGMLTR